MSRSTDGNLLFGLLALQNNFIDRDGLLDAFSRWVHNRATSLGQVLCDRGALELDDFELLQALAIKHLKKFGDDPEKSLQHLSSIGSVREDLGRIADADLQASLALVAAARADEDPYRTISEGSLGASTSDRQRFRILRPHAQGGLGAVFLALDGDLHREVALKQILDRHADDAISRARFLLEAEITGGLEHPGIVPVYGLGTYSDGRPFYAMRFIRGESLKEAIGRFHADESLKGDTGLRSLGLRKLLRRFLDVCFAIDYAHSRGIMHRDIKPSNIIVGKHGETLVVDWGLAKPLGQSRPGDGGDERTLVPSPASGNAAETLPGSALGTPSYMSPEQAAGDLDRLGPLSDVYSLGATLYCLLAGKPPFEGSDAGLIIRQVRQGEFPLPRATAPAADRALQAICLKAMSLRPEDRYGSPREMAEDIERWMADEPIIAVREGISSRLARKIRRHPAVAAWVLFCIVIDIMYFFMTVYMPILLRPDRESRQQIALEVAEYASSLDRSIDRIDRIATLDKNDKAFIKSILHSRKVESSIDHVFRGMRALNLMNFAITAPIFLSLWISQITCLLGAIIGAAVGWTRGSPNRGLRQGARSGLIAGLLLALVSTIALLTALPFFRMSLGG